MLLEFSVSNFRSIYKRQTLSLVASSGNELAENNVYELKGHKPKSLRSAVIYGANAAGKSNLLRAALFAQNLIIQSAIALQEGMKISVPPFAFSETAQNESSEFEFLFVEDGVRYNYCFAVNGERVTKEWLVAYPHNKPQRWFEREFDAKTGKYNWSLGTNFKGEKAQQHVWQNSTRTNALFLSMAVNLNNDQLKPVFRWFQTKLIIVLPDLQINPFLSLSLLQNASKKHLVEQFMQIADVGIESLELTEEDFHPKPGRTANNFNISWSQTPGTPPKILKILAMHKKIGSNDLIPLEMQEESDGTKKIFEFAGGWIKVLEDGATILVDELDRSLHPIMTRFLVSLFHDADKNSKGAQLVFTTHDTTLLDTELFRRDQIWFVEKHEGCTNLYPLLDYSPRKDEALERGYLKGRYGAIPFIGTFNLL
jgi:AAA15 family ATPase/GTPase